MITKQSFAALCVAALSSLATVISDPFPQVGSYQLYTGPANQTKEAYDSWQNDFLDWASSMDVGDLAPAYDNPQLQWARRSFIQPQVMLHDRYIFDRDTGEFTIGPFLEDVRSRYGGVDSVLLWVAYPNIGIDDRNMFDMHRDVSKDGLPGLAKLVAEFHAENIKVLLAYMPWDTQTNTTGDEENGNVNVMAQLVKDTGADGFNGDTMNGVGNDFFEAGLEVDWPLALEPEGMGTDTSLAFPSELKDDVMSWNYWFYSFADDLSQPPFVSTFKYLTEGRHLAAICDRWCQDRTNDLQMAFFNGAGFESWENVWGVWNGITPRDAAALQRTSTIIRYFGDLVQGSYGTWLPHLPLVGESGSRVYASGFFNSSHNLFLLVNRNEDEPVPSPTFTAPCDPTWKSWFVYDAYSGASLDGFENVTCSDDSATMVLVMPEGYVLEAKGFGALLVTESDLLADTGSNDDGGFADFLAQMEALTEVPLSSFSDAWEPLAQTLANSSSSKIAINAKTSFSFVSLADEVLVPSGTFNFSCTGNAIENPTDGGRGYSDAGVDVQFSWEAFPRYYHEAVLEMQPMFMDRYPVTNGEYRRFVNETGWKPPVDSTNWVRHWTDGNDSGSGNGNGSDNDSGNGNGNGSGNDNSSEDKQPVRWVSLNDAAAYCAAAGKRLPSTLEWQWAAQGPLKPKWPWGNEDPNAELMPKFSNAPHVQPTPDAVDSHPTGASWAGVQDLVGNVYQWTDGPFQDDHTNHAVLRGGSKWRPNYYWYFPEPLNLESHSTFLLLSEGLDRNGGTGFRCARTAPG